MKNSTLIINQPDQVNSSDMEFNGKGVMEIVPAGTLANIDLLMIDDCFLNGGQMKVSGSAFGDKASCQVIHPTAGVVKEFITDYYIGDAEQTQFNITLPYFAKIQADLTLRLVYKSTGNSSVKVAINWGLHKALR